jgi:transposase
VTDTTRLDVSSLPTDADALRALVLSMMAEQDALKSERDALTAERDALLERTERLHHLLLRLKRLQFGCKSERLPEAQLQLGLEDLEAALAKGEAEKRDPDLRKEGAARRRARRGALPADLPRVAVTLTPDDTACPCCRAEMAVIGEDTSERLDVVPARFRVLVTRRPKLVCRACAGGVVQTPAPPRLIEGGLPTEALVAHVLVSRYADHLPLYRQAQILARQGVVLERSTLAFWVGYAAAEITPVVARLRALVRGAGVRRRDSRSRARPRAGPDEEGLLLDHRARRPPLGWDGPAGGGLQLRPGPRAGACRAAARRLSRHPAVRRLHDLQAARRSPARRRVRDPGVLLEPHHPNAIAA